MKHARGKYVNIHVFSSANWPTPLSVHSAILAMCVAKYIRLRSLCRIICSSQGFQNRLSVISCDASLMDGSVQFPNPWFKHDPELANRFPCDVCGKTFSTEMNFKNHRRLTHEKTIQCPLCPEKFKRTINLESHLSKFRVDLKGVQFSWLDISGIDAALFISITLFSNHLK